MPARTTAVVLGLLAIAFASLWLSDILRAIAANTVPESITVDGIPTNPVHVLDLAWILPALIITAIGLVQHRPFAVVLAGAALTFAVLMGLAILAIFAFTFAANAAAAPGPAVAFAAVVVLCGVTLSVYVRNIRS